MESVEESILPVEIIRMIAECNHNAILKIGSLCRVFYHDLYVLRRQRCNYIFRDHDPGKHKIYFTARSDHTKVIETIEIKVAERVIIGELLGATKCTRTYYTDTSGRKCVRYEVSGNPHWGLESYEGVIDNDDDDFERVFEKIKYNELIRLSS
ncbi:hypothetical protein F-LCD7_0008 [Faustovirus]|nr:hypothetical protein F-LCD7_0008 [Faustovirus]QJX72769.1 hypothetical protein F-VV57_0007 [Faustovirus]QJX73274.1 hypothetical protein F-VV63_0008 [Faustovirus]